MNPILIGAAGVAAFMLMKKDEKEIVNTPPPPPTAPPNDDPNQTNFPDSTPSPTEPPPRIGVPTWFVNSRYFDGDNIRGSFYPYFSKEGNAPFSDALRSALLSSSGKFYDINLTTGQKELFNADTRKYLANTFLRNLWDLLIREKKLTEQEADNYIHFHLDEILAVGIANDKVRQENEKKIKEYNDAQAKKVQEENERKAAVIAAEEADKIAQAEEKVRIEQNWFNASVLETGMTATYPFPNQYSFTREGLEAQGIYLDDDEFSRIGDVMRAAVTLPLNAGSVKVYQLVFTGIKQMMEDLAMVRGFSLGGTKASDKTIAKAKEKFAKLR